MLVFLERGKFPPMKKDGRTVLRKLAVWPWACGLMINSNKTELVYFHKRNNDSAFEAVIPDGVEIKLSDREK